MRTPTWLGLLILPLLGASARSVDSLCAGIVPPNDLRIPVSVRAGGISESDFRAVLDRVESIYRPIFAARGAKLVVSRYWEDPAVGAYAEKDGKTA